MTIRFSLFALWLIACTTSRTSEQHLDMTAAVDKKAAVQEEVQIKRAEGPSLELTFAPPSVDDVPTPVGGASAADAGHGVQVAHNGPSVAAGANRTKKGAQDIQQHADGLPPHGALIKAVFRGATSEEMIRLANLQETEYATLREQQDKKEKAKAAPSAGCTFGLGVWGLVALAVLGAAAWLYFRRLLP